MARLKQFRNPKLSLWQSAVNEVIAKRTAGAQPQTVEGARVIGSRPEVLERPMAEATSYCDAVDSGKPLADVATGPIATEGVGHTLGYCSIAAMKLAKALILRNAEDQARYRDELSRFGDCDPGYAEAAAKYAEYFVAQGKTIPYRGYQNFGQFVIDDKLPPNAKVAIVGDWGTGQDAAKEVLKQIAAKNPDVVIHLGDIYYAGTDFEDQSYFYQPWSQILDLDAKKIPTFTLSGNHDMYSGGVPYYKLIDQLGQPASYFCLRNDQWQFVAIDTGLHDHNPLGGGPTLLEDTEVAWVKDRIDNAGGRRTVLLSHHQLFTAYDAIDGEEVNMKLYGQLSSHLAKVPLWLWGHEHNFVVYGPYMGLERGRCLGHGAFPVGFQELPAEPKFSDVPLVKLSDGSDIRLGITEGLYNHGYAIVELRGRGATVSYYQDTDEVNPLYQEAIP